MFKKFQYNILKTFYEVSRQLQCKEGLSYLLFTPMHYFNFEGMKH